MGHLRLAPLAALAAFLLTSAPAQVPSASSLPATAPTTAAVAPIAAIATPADRAGSPRHRAVVTCAGGQLAVQADNSSLNGILRSVAKCTGMRITGGVVDQRVYGNYGPAMPATVLATLLDGTGTNILLKESAEDQPKELILTPRQGGPTPPPPSQVADDEGEDGPAAPSPTFGSRNAGSPAPATAAGVTHPAAAATPSGPISIPSPINNVLGSPNNTSPTAANYPTTNSVPLDSLPTPSTATEPNGIVDAPNPPPAGSDTAALLNGRTTNQPGNTTITDQPTSSVAAGAAGNSGISTSGSSNGTAASGAGSSLTPQQVFEQLQKLRQGQAATQSSGNSSTSSGTTDSQTNSPQTTNTQTTAPQN